MAGKADVTPRPPARTRRHRRLNRAIWVIAGLTVAVAALSFVFRISLTVDPAQALAQGNELLRTPTVLALVAHPDDLEWYIGGTLRRLADENANVQVIVASLGEKGPNRIDAANLPETRRQEQLRAAEILGYDHVYFLELPDREVSSGPVLMQRVTEIYAQVKPDAVLMFDPHYPSLPYLHPDHQGSARKFLQFWRDLPGSRPALYLFQTRRPDTAVDISDVIDTKGRALAQHASQNGGRISGRMSSVHAGYGELVGVEYAELFRVLR